MLRDAVFGFAVGDALGVPYEFMPRGTFECKKMTGFGTHNQELGTWSDDTSMILATCKSIKDCGCINLRDMAEKFIDWYKYGKYTARGEVFDVGSTTAQALSRYAETGDVCTCGLDDVQSNGNGGLMRILPLAYVKDCSWFDISDVCGITHRHPISLNAAFTYVSMLRNIDMGRYITNRHSSGKSYDSMKESEIKSTGYVIDTLEAATWAFLTTDNYKDCVLKAVNLGGDTDTIGALAGGLAGAKYGFGAIPVEWIKKLANKELIERCLF